MNTDTEIVYHILWCETHHAAMQWPWGDLPRACPSFARVQAGMWWDHPGVASGCQFRELTTVTTTDYGLNPRLQFGYL